MSMQLRYKSFVLGQGLGLDPLLQLYAQPPGDVLQIRCYCQMANNLRPGDVLHVVEGSVLGAAWWCMLLLLVQIL